MARDSGIDQVRGAAKTAIERVAQTSDHVREQMTRTLERTDDPSGRLSRHMPADRQPLCQPQRLRQVP